MTKNDIKKLSNLKIKAARETLVLCDKVGEVLRNFDGKSITGNKKRITDAIEGIAKGLRCYIEPDGFGWVKLRVIYYPQDRRFQTDGGNWADLDSDNTIIWDTSKGNVLDLTTILCQIQNAKVNFAKRVERCQYTARNIEKIADKVEKLKNELSKINLGTDSELTDAFGISFKHY